MLTLNTIAKQALTIARARGFADKDVLKHLAGEVIEASEAYTNRNIENYSHELADVIICALSASAQLDIDIEKAIEEKLFMNAKRITKHSTMLSTGRTSIDE